MMCVVIGILYEESVRDREQVHFHLLRKVHEGHSAYGFPSSRVSVYEATATIPRTTTTAAEVIIVYIYNTCYCCICN